MSRPWMILIAILACLAALQARAGVPSAKDRTARHTSGRATATAATRQALSAYVGGPADSGPSNRLAERVVGLVDGYHFNRAIGRSKLAASAARKVRKIAHRFGLEAPVEAALAAGIGFAKSSTHRSAVAIRRNRPGSDSDSPLPPGHAAARPEGSTRRLHPVSLWWTGDQTAYLDLLYRRLPKLLENHIKQAPHQAFRIWHAGHEDASQTFLLTAIVDEAIARLAVTKPELASALQSMPVSIQATDLVQRLNRTGRDIRFMVDRGPVFEKQPILLSEIAPDEAKLARPVVKKLEQQIATGNGPYTEALARLADEGKLQLLFARLLEPSEASHGKHQSRVVGGSSVTPNYRLWRSDWRVFDGENGGQINPGASRRAIQFVHEDLTRRHPPQLVNLAVCTHVLDHLALYEGEARAGQTKHQPLKGGELSPLQQAMHHLVAGIAKGGALLVDKRSLKHLRNGGHLTMTRQHQGRTKPMAELRAGNKALWVTQETELEEIDLSTDAAN